MDDDVQPFDPCFCGSEMDLVCEEPFIMWCPECGRLRTYLDGENLEERAPCRA